MGGGGLRPPLHSLVRLPDPRLKLGTPHLPTPLPESDLITGSSRF